MNTFKLICKPNPISCGHLKGGSTGEWCEGCNRLGIESLTTPKEEIRPKEAGELWELGTVFYLTCFDNKGGLQFADHLGNHGVIGDSSYNPIHNQNEWKRLFPEVPEENEIVIEGVKWESDGDVVYTYTNEQVFDWDSLVNLPLMTMKLIPKEKS